MKSPQLLLLGLSAVSTVLCSSIGTQAPIVDTVDQSWTSNPTSAHSLLSLHKALIEIESITGNEASATSWLAKYLQHQGLTVEKQKVEGSRYNLYAYLGNTRKTKVLVSSHIDTVPPFWKYEYHQSDSTIWGRGSVDAKGSVAAQLKAFEALVSDDAIKQGDVSLLFVVGEETGGDGMRSANDLDLTWNSAIFGEPTELKLASGHKGNIAITITAHGKAGHSGYPELGRSANLMLVQALSKLASATFPSSEKYGNTTLNIGKISGGVAGNVIAETAVANITVRIAAGNPQDVKDVVLAAIETTGYAAADLVVDFSPGYPPIDIDHDIPGFDEIVVNYGTDIPNLKGDHKRYLYGPGDILVAHSDHEHLKVEDLETAVKGYKTLIKANL